LQNVFAFEIRILRQEFINTASCSDLPDDHTHGNAYPADASFATHDFGSLCDAIQLFHAGSPSLVMQQYYSDILLRGHWTLREFCVTQCCFVMLGGAKCSGRHAASC